MVELVIIGMLAFLIYWVFAIGHGTGKALEECNEKIDKILERLDEGIE